MSIFNGNSPPGRTVYVLLAESVQGDRRKMLETGLSLMPGLQQVRLRIGDKEHVVFETAPAQAAMLIARLPAEMRGMLITRLEHQVRSHLLCPA